MNTKYLSRTVIKPGQDTTLFAHCAAPATLKPVKASFGALTGRFAHRPKPQGRAINALKTCALTLAAAVGLAGCAAVPSGEAPQVAFNSFSYTGKDAVFDQPLAENEYFNPVIAGFYSDPTMTRAGDEYYLTTSSFAYFPGAPIFKSQDLVNWEQIGHILDRPEQFHPEGVRVTRGMFAPTLRYHDGTFYMITTAVDAGGNFIVTADDPAGPWSDPIWLPEVGGIDPDIFFDDDGRIYIAHNDAPPGEPQYDGHRAIWLWEYDPEQKAVIKESRQLLVNGGVDIEEEPVWIEAPHIFKKDGWYYLSCAEGGTGYNHSQVIFRSRSLDEPFVPYEGNPILTQRDLDIDRDNPITTAGHADMVKTQNGEWWAIFLATRAYDQTAFNTGRESFLLPVTWKDGWPQILPAGKEIPYRLERPDLPLDTRELPPTTGNFSWSDDFDGETLKMQWAMQLAPQGDWFELGDSALTFKPRAISLDSLQQPAFLGKRQQHMSYSAELAVALPEGRGYSGGLAVFQSETHHYYLGVERTTEGYELFLEQARGGEPQVIRRQRLEQIEGKSITLSVEQDAGRISFFARPAENRRLTLAEQIDGKLLSTEVAGGFTGVMIGPHARLEDSKNKR